MESCFLRIRSFLLVLKFFYFVFLFNQNLCSAAIVNEEIFGSVDCVPYAYADFNADKFVDIYCVAKPGDRIEIWIAQESMDPLFLLYRKTYLKINSTIVNIVPGDFNGDSIIDMLVVYEMGRKFQMSLFLGNKQSRYENDLEPEIQLQLEILDHPFAADVDGDGKIDLLVQTESNDLETDSGRKILKFSDSGQISQEIVQEGSTKQLYTGYSNSFTDLNNDFTPDLLLTTKSSDKMIFEEWTMGITVKRNYEFLKNYAAPDGIKYYGQSLFADLDSDGTIEHILPVCKDDKCEKSAVFIYQDEKWSEINIDFGTYGFIPPNGNKEFWNKNAAMSIKVGDYDLNGYLDLLMVLRDNNSTDSNDKSAILMKNIQNTEKNTFSFDRAFKIDNHMTSLFSYTNVVQVSFFDLYDDGYLDVLLTLKEYDSDKNPSYKLVAFKNEYFDDVYFIKVMVIPGTCSSDKCPYSNLPYGLNYPGALIRMETTSYEYQKVVLYASQLSQSAHMSLQLPYTIFGLGATPNFVEELKVGFLALSENNEIKGIGKEWRQIIPNSQLVINPFPRNYPFYWKMQLFITPSKNILKTAISLGSTMIFLIIIIGILQFREKKMDEKERKLESQRFHFDGL